MADDGDDDSADSGPSDADMAHAAEVMAAHGAGQPPAEPPVEPASEGAPESSPVPPPFVPRGPDEQATPPPPRSADDDGNHDTGPSDADVAYGMQHLAAHGGGAPPTEPDWVKTQREIDALDDQWHTMPAGPDKDAVFIKLSQMRDADNAAASRSMEASRLAEDAAAKKRDESTRGCSPALLGAAGVVLAILIGGFVLLFGDNDDACAQPATRSDAAAFASCLVDGPDKATSTTKAEPDNSPTGDGVKGDPGSLAGHYVLSGGLDDPNGLDEGMNVPIGTTTLGPRSASFDVAADGSVTGGMYDTSHTTTEAACSKTVSLTASSATGTFHPEGFGSVKWNGTQTLNQTCRATGTTAWPFELYFYFEGDQLVACHLLPGKLLPTEKPSSCDEGKPAGYFARG